MKMTLILFCPVLLFGQNVLKIDYGGTLSFETPIENHIFSFKDNGKDLELTGSEISKYRFMTPGVYTVRVDEIHSRLHLGQGSEMEEMESCSHPKLGDSFIVEVDSVRIKFIPNSIALSQPIYKNKNTVGMFLSIDVEVENYYDRLVSMNTEKVISAGIGSNIYAILAEEVKYLNPGHHKLRYELGGICAEASYIQFDFKAHNGNIVPIALKSPVLE